LPLHPLKAGCIDVALRARYKRAAAITVLESGGFLISDLFLRFFVRPFKPLLPGREGFVTANFSNKINHLKNTAKAWVFRCCGKKNR
jgi:hypothetical protein